MEQMLEYKKIRVGIINLQINNLFSIFQAFKAIGYNAEIIDEKKINYNYNIVILPGVGTFAKAMNFIKKNDIDKKIHDFLNKDNKLIFGICLGMQLLFEKSNEIKKTEGLKLIPGEVKKLESKKFRIPNIGWLNITIKDKKKNFISRSLDNHKFYFVHSYHCIPKNDSVISSYVRFDNQNICSSVKKNNILGTQFHPEKSGLDGLKIIKDLIKII